MGGAIFAPRRFTQLDDAPGIIETAKFLRGNGAGDALEFVAAPTFVMVGARSILDYGAAGVITTTTLAAQLASGSTTASLADASSYKAGHGMAIPGAGAAGVELVVTLTNVVGNVVSWSGATSTTVATGTTVHHDDTAAISTVIASGYHVYAPKGYYNVCGGAQGITALTTPYQTIYGDGWGWTVFYSRSTADYVFRLYGSGTRLFDFSLGKSSSIGNPTAGGGVLVGDIGGSVCYHNRLEGLNLSGLWDNLVWTLASQGRVYDLVLSTHHRYGMWVNAPNPRGGNFYANIMISGYSSPASEVAGLHISSADLARWVNIGVYDSKQTFSLKSENGFVAGQHFINCTSDSSGAKVPAYPVKVEKGTYFCSHNSFTSLMSNGSASGPYIGSGVQEFSLINYHATSNQDINNYGEYTKIDGGIFRDVIFRTAAAHGICRGATIGRDLIVENNSVGHTITGNSVYGVGTIGTGVRASSVIRVNKGVPDYITSIAAAPEFIGQEALVSGIWYRAVGTSSTSDWKALN